MKHVKKTVNYKILWIVVGAVLGVFIISYGAAAYYFSSHFGFNTSINSIDCTFKTVEEVEQTISRRVASYELRIIGRDGMNKRIRATEIALTYVPDGQVDAILVTQNPLLWIARLFGNVDGSATRASVKLDTTKLKTAVDRFDLFNAEKANAPVDARPEFKDSAYVVRPEELGNTLDESRTRRAIDDALHTLALTIDLDEEGCYVPPKIFSNNPDLIEQVRIYNVYVPFSITYTFGDETELLDASIALDWIDIAEDGTGTLNEAALIAWMQDFGLRHDTVGAERTFITAAGEEATVTGGTYGWEVDEEAEVEAVKAALVNRIGETREPYYVQRAAEHLPSGQPDWGTTYIELDLTNQHMYYIVDGAVEFEADVVTGSPWGGRATPAGVYSILEKLSPTVLRGEIQASGKPEYETPVSYWMRMTWAGHGFHDATWQPWFGGSRYTFAGSHGCINMSYSSARTLYGILEMGTPVVSHY